MQKKAIKTRKYKQIIPKTKHSLLEKKINEKKNFKITFEKKIHCQFNEKKNEANVN